MFRLKESMHVNAPVDRCFLLATSIGLVQQTLKMTPVAGKAGYKSDGLIVGEDRVLWKGWKFGIPARHESLISEYDRPNFFQDTMARGYFKHFQHDHRFEDIDGRTLMIDVVRFSLPFGAAGRMVGKHTVVPHVLDLLLSRFQLLKRIAEGPDWERYVAGAESLAEGEKNGQRL